MPDRDEELRQRFSLSYPLPVGARFADFFPDNLRVGTYTGIKESVIRRISTSPVTLPEMLGHLLDEAPLGVDVERLWGDIERDLRKEYGTRLVVGTEARRRTWHEHLLDEDGL